MEIIKLVVKLGNKTYELVSPYKNHGCIECDLRRDCIVNNGNDFDDLCWRMNNAIFKEVR